jgi:methylenetetrahydrofolate reductase (NADPH)
MWNSNNQSQKDEATEMQPAETVIDRAQAISGLLANSSIELSTNGREAIMGAAEYLPPETPVYVPKHPAQTLDDKLVQLRMLREFGLNPIPHISAREVNSERELQAFLTIAVAEAKVNRVLVIGADALVAAGPFSDSASVIESGLLKQAGIKTVDVAGYPEDHPRIPKDVLRADLQRKIGMAKDQGLDFNIVTQFSFVASNIVEYCSELAETAPGIPVYVGLAGPTNAVRLLKFARRCGVGASMKAISSLGMNAVKLAGNTRPDKLFDALVDQKITGNTGNLKGVHLFSFGGFVESAEWLKLMTPAAAT